MGVTSEILGNSGSPHQIEHNGKVYPVRLIDQDVQSAYEKRLYEKDCAAVRMQFEQGLLTQPQYTERLTELSTAFRNGDYEMLSPNGLVMLKSLPGVRLLLTLIVQCPANELIPLLLAKRTEITQLVRVVIQESFPGVDLDEAGESSGNPETTGQAAPNAQTPAV